MVVKDWVVNTDCTDYRVLVGLDTGREGMSRKIDTPFSCSVLLVLNVVGDSLEDCISYVCYIIKSTTSFIFVN